LPQASVPSFAAHHCCCNSGYLLRLGSLFPQFPEIRQSFLWPYLREAWPYGVAALTISFAAYEGEVMRGAFAGVPAGELELAVPMA
jgi:ABC-type arginine/histidine transport system permease subunit